MRTEATYCMRMHDSVDFLSLSEGSDKTSAVQSRNDLGDEKWSRSC